MPRHTRAVVAMAWTLLLIAGCSDKGTEPQPVEYFLYAGIAANWPEIPEAFVAIIDCRTDSVIDSIFHDFTSTVGVSASPDGRFLGTQSGADPPVIIWDAATQQALAGLPRFTGALTPLFLPDAGLVLTPERGVTRIYRLSDFVLDTALDLELFGARQIPGSHRVMGIDQRRGVDFKDNSKLAIYDYIGREELDSIIINPDENGFGFGVGHFDFSPDGRILYISGSQPDVGIGVSIVAYDLAEDVVIYMQPVRSGVRGFKVSPDGREIWIADPGPSVYDLPSKTIDIYNAATGLLLDSVLLTGFREESELSLAANFIEFLPTGDKAYVNCGGWLHPKGAQPLLVIDTGRRQVIKLIYPDFLHRTETVAVAPKP